MKRLSTLVVGTIIEYYLSHALIIKRDLINQTSTIKFSDVGHTKEQIIHWFNNDPEVRVIGSGRFDDNYILSRN